MTRDQDNPGVRFPPPFIYLGVLLAGLAADLALEGTRAAGFGVAQPIRLGAAIVLGAAGLAVIGAAIRLFRKAGTSEKPWETSTAIVTSGIYRVTRNPMYLGLALLYAAVAIALDAPAVLMLLPVVIAIIASQVIAREERYLAAKFGAPYEEYRRRVRRWL